MPLPPVVDLDLDIIDKRRVSDIALGRAGKGRAAAQDVVPGIVHTETILVRPGLEPFDKSRVIGPAQYLFELGGQIGCYVFGKGHFRLRISDLGSRI